MNRRMACFLFLACITIVWALLPNRGALAANDFKEQRRGSKLLIKNLSPGQAITEHEWGTVKIEVGTEGSPARETAKKRIPYLAPLKVKVDNKEIASRVLSSTTGNEGKKAYTYRTVGVRLGPQPGKRIITIVSGRFSRTIPVNYEPSGKLEIAGIYDDQAILGKSPVSVRLFGCFLEKESVKASINGEAIPAELAFSEEAPELLQGSVAPGDKLIAGTNTLKIEAVDSRGAKLAKELKFHYYPDNKVRVGDTFVLDLGSEELKNRPLHNVVVDGASIVKKEEFILPSGPERIDGQTVVPGKATLLARLEAVAPGEAVVAMPQETEKKVLVVYPVPPAANVYEVAGQMLENYSAENLFICAIPKDWHRILDPERDRKIYGISAYQTKQEDELTAKVSIEFHTPDNQVKTAEEYIRGLTKETPLQQEERELATQVIEYVQNLLQPKPPKTQLAVAPHVLATTIAGRSATTVERIVYATTKKMVFFNKKTPLEEKSIVIPAREGFYVLNFRSPAADSERNRELFEAIIKSFAPLK